MLPTYLSEVKTSLKGSDCQTTPSRVAQLVGMLLKIRWICLVYRITAKHQIIRARAHIQVEIGTSIRLLALKYNTIPNKNSV